MDPEILSEAVKVQLTKKILTMFFSPSLILEDVRLSIPKNINFPRGPIFFYGDSLAFSLTYSICDPLLPFWIGPCQHKGFYSY